VFEGRGLNAFRPLGVTRAWNWQQGASLQWLRRDEQLFAVNDIVDGAPRSPITDLEGEIRDSMPLHLADVCPRGRYGVSYCFRRLSRGAPGYGYTALNKKTEHDRIEVVDLDKKCTVFALTLEELTAGAGAGDGTIQGAYHFFSHALFSPDGKRLLFYHRWRQHSGVLRTHLYSVGLGGEDLFLFPGDDYSHVAWKDEQQVLAYCRGNGQPWGYYLISDRDGTAVRIGEDYFSSDGHPQFRHDGRVFVTDTYPDRFRQQRLFTYDIERGCGSEIARLKIPFKYRSERRCDFHPRWRPDGGAICFDSAHTGIRSLCVIEI
jgi:hypothetical protein